MVQPEVRRLLISSMASLSGMSVSPMEAAFSSGVCVLLIFGGRVLHDGKNYSIFSIIFSNNKKELSFFPVSKLFACQVVDAAGAGWVHLRH